MLLWLAVAAFGFVALVGVVIVLGLSTTARYEFDRNRVESRRQQPAAAPRARASRAGGRPAGRTARADRGAQAAARPRAVAVAAQPAVERAAETGWWLLAESGEQVVAGPFADRVEADWAALAGGLPHRVTYGVRRTDGALVTRPSPEERAWHAELAQQLDRLAEDWEPLVSDTDPLTTLVVEVTAALVEAGLPLHDGSRRNPAGGVCLTPDPGHRGVLVSWRQHDRMSRQQVRGAAADAAVQHTMNVALAGVLAQLGFQVEPLATTGCHLVSTTRH